METRINFKRSAAILLLLAAVFAGGIARWCMSSGIGVNPDSAIYLTAAASASSGQGLRPIAFHYSPNVAGGRPLVIFPPAYPLLLSLSGIRNVNSLNRARWLHSLLFAINTMLIGVAVYFSTKGSLGATLCSVLLFLSSPGILRIHTMALSEPPFISFILTAFILLALHIVKPKAVLLLGASLAAGLAMTTRYAGVTILPPMIITLLLLKNSVRRARLKDCAVLLGVGIFPLVAWFLRNLVVGESAANRSLAFHPMRTRDLGILVDSLLTLGLPLSSNAYAKMFSLLVGGALVVSGIMFGLRRPEQGERSPSANSVTQLFAALFVASYLLFLFAYNSLVDPSADLGVRVLSPVYVFGIILTITVVYRLSKVGKRATIWWGGLILLFALISANAGRAVSFAVQRKVRGSGFTSPEWARSKSIEYVKTLPDNRTMYSNGIDVIHLLTGRKALRLPAKFDPTGGKANAEFEQHINELRNELTHHRAVLIYLDKITWRWYLPTRDEIESVYKLPVLRRFDDGVVYGFE